MATIESRTPAPRRYAAMLLRNRQEGDDLVYDCLLRALDHLEVTHDNDAIRIVSRLGTNFGQNDYKQSDNALRALHCLPKSNAASRSSYRLKA